MLNKLFISGFFSYLKSQLPFFEFFDFREMILIPMVVHSNFVEFKHKTSIEHVIYTTTASLYQCERICLKDTFCQGYSQSNLTCTTFFYLPDFSRVYSESQSLFVKDEPFKGAFSDGYLIMRRTSPKECDKPICEVTEKQELVSSEKSSKIKTTLGLRFEDYPLVSSPSQYWKNVTDNTTLYDCLSQCDVYPTCMAIQYIFNSTTCGMMSVWPGELFEINGQEVISSHDLDVELFLKIDYKEHGFKVNKTVPKLNRRNIDLSIKDCMAKCAEDPICTSIYYDKSCYLIEADGFGGTDLETTALEGVHLEKRERNEMALLEDQVLYNSVISSEENILSTTSTKGGNKTVKTSRTIVKNRNLKINVADNATLFGLPVSITLSVTISIGFVLLMTFFCFYTLRRKARKNMVNKFKEVHKKEKKERQKMLEERERKKKEQILREQEYNILRLKESNATDDKNEKIHIEKKPSVPEIKVSPDNSTEDKSNTVNVKPHRQHSKSITENDSQDTGLNAPKQEIRKSITKLTAGNVSLSLKAENDEHINKVRSVKKLEGGKLGGSIQLSKSNDLISRQSERNLNKDSDGSFKIFGSVASISPRQ